MRPSKPPPPVVIAEAGVNHNGERAMALELVDVAANAGVDLVKFQAFSADTLTSADAPAAGYQSERTGQSDQRAVLSSLELDQEDFEAIAERCRDRGIDFLCTPFDLDMLDPLVALGMPAIKVASGELTNANALARIGALGMPVYLSTGMATLEEVRQALEALRRAGAGEVTVLHCTSLYPAPMDSLNLRAIATLQRELGVPVGYSDHSEGLYAAVAAVALGASVLEKHVTLDRTLPGPDHAASLEPGELTEMVRAVRALADALGDGVKRPTAAEAETARVARRSWHACRDLAAGQRLCADDVVPLRPEVGVPANRSVVDRVLARDVAAGAAIMDEDLAG